MPPSPGSTRSRSSRTAPSTPPTGLPRWTFCYRDGKPLPGGFKLGVNPGLVKWEGTQSVLWGEGVREQFNAPDLNLARYIKDGTVTDQDTGE